MHILIIDEKITAACVVSECGIPWSESANYIDGSTVHGIRDANSCMNQDKHSAIATQQEDNGRSRGSSDNVNNASCIKGYHSNHNMWFIHYLGMCPYMYMKYLANTGLWCHVYNITCTLSKQLPAIIIQPMHIIMYQY